MDFNTFINITQVKMPNQKMNQILRDRKTKNKLVASYRKQRIVRNYHKLQHNNAIQQQNKEIQHDQGTRRKLQFYQSVFNQQNQQKPQPKDKKIVQEIQPNNGEAKLQKLKNKKKKFIKKMQMEKTKKGQPVMRNYIKYALAKLEETLQKQKNDKKH